MANLNLRDISLAVLAGVLLLGSSCRTVAPSPLADRQPTAQSKIVSPDAKLELVWGEGSFTEGPVAAPDGSILFTDIPTNRILRFFPDRGKTYLFRENSGRANGLAFDDDGNLLACEGGDGGGRCLTRLTADGNVTKLTEKYLKDRLNSPNDLAVAPNGWIYFTDPRYGNGQDRELDFEGVFVYRHGFTTLATREVQRPNGILVSRDGQYVFVADNNNEPGGAQQLLRFTTTESGRLANRKVLLDFGPDRRGIDGMALDEWGNIYATAGSGEDAGVYVFSRTMELLAFIKVPDVPTNCCFGGRKAPNMLYITAMAHPAANGMPAQYGLFRIPLNVKGIEQ